MPISDAAVEAVSGALGSVLAVAVTYPLTTVGSALRATLSAHTLSCSTV